MGEYGFSDEKLQDSVGILPPKSPHRWFYDLGDTKIQKNATHLVRAYDNCYVAFGTFAGIAPLIHNDYY